MAKHEIVRITWLDNLKSFAIFFLFWAHCCGCLTSSLNLFFVAWHMPLFVFASGYTSVGLRDKIRDWNDVDSFVQKLALRIGLPNLLYTTLAMAMGYGLSHRWDRMGMALTGTVFFMGLGYLFFSSRISKCRWIKYGLILVSFISTPIWYLPFLMETMIIFTVVQCLCVKYFKNIKWVFVLIFVFIMAIIPSPFHATAEFILIFLVAMAANDRKDQLMKIYHKIKIPGMLILCVVMFSIGWIAFKRYESMEHQFYLTWWYSLVQDGDWLTFPLRQVAILMFVPVFTMIIVLCSRKYNWFSGYGALTLGLYPLNCIFVVVFKVVFDASNRYALDTSLWWLVLVYMLAVLLSSIGLVEILNKNKFTRFCFLGSK